MASCLLPHLASREADNPTTPTGRAFETYGRALTRSISVSPFAGSETDSSATNIEETDYKCSVCLLLNSSCSRFAATLAQPAAQWGLHRPIALDMEIMRDEWVIDSVS
jgi:hypothetical protein